MTYAWCGERTVFTSAELDALDAKGGGYHVLEDGYGCELESGHPGSHLFLAQAYDDGELWLSWNGEHRELLQLGPCEAETDGWVCELPAGHYGRHSSEDDVQTGRLSPLSYAEAAAEPEQ
ncbi:MAG TPA: hypothetical protein VFA45_20735 [Actinomycetes bacterium]|nr:hypothetical protein [Actinomycetes bacterium]